MCITAIIPVISVYHTACDTTIALIPVISVSYSMSYLCPTVSVSYSISIIALIPVISVSYYEIVDVICNMELSISRIHMLYDTCCMIQISTG